MLRPLGKEWSEQAKEKRETPMPHPLSYNAPPIFVNFGDAMKFGGDPSRTVAEQPRTNGARGASKQTRNSNWIRIAAQGLP
jgi:hypothetical protein